MKIVVIDGQGGKLGRALVEEIRALKVACELIAVGTNAIATQAMMTAKPDGGATGENAVIFNCKDADYIVGPIGILVANALLGEISPAITQAVSSSRAKKILLPQNRCGVSIVGTMELTLSEQIRQAVQQIAAR